MARIALLHNPNNISHKAASFSPENPERLEKALRFLKARTYLFSRDRVDLIEDFGEAAIEEINAVHDPLYVDFVRDYCSKGGGFLGDSTYFSPSTYSVARTAAQGAIIAAEMVVKGEYESTFAFVRPPGHHATRDRYSGYCIFNNGAVTAKHLQRMRKKRIMFIDWDAHAGNGTSSIFYDNPTVLTLSIHRDPHEFYPHEGFAYQIGSRDGRGYNINVEMPKGSGDREYKLVFQEIVEPVMREFSPDFVLGINGFDSHYSDNYAGLQVSEEGFYFFGDFLRRRAAGNFSIIMEGGYSSNSNGKLTHSLLAGMGGWKMPYSSGLDRLSVRVLGTEKTYSIVRKKIKELKSILGDYYSF